MDGKKWRCRTLVRKNNCRSRFWYFRGALRSAAHHKSNRQFPTGIPTFGCANSAWTWRSFCTNSKSKFLQCSFAGRQLCGKQLFLTLCPENNDALSTSSTSWPAAARLQTRRSAWTEAQGTSEEVAKTLVQMRIAALLMHFSFGPLFMGQTCETFAIK